MEWQNISNDGKYYYINISLCVNGPFPNFWNFYSWCVSNKNYNLWNPLKVLSQPEINYYMNRHTVSQSYDQTPF